MPRHELQPGTVESTRQPEAAGGNQVPGEGIGGQKYHHAGCESGQANQHDPAGAEFLRRQARWNGQRRAHRHRHRQQESKLQVAESQLRTQMDSGHRKQSPAPGSNNKARHRQRQHHCQ